MLTQAISIWKRGPEFTGDYGGRIPTAWCWVFHKVIADQNANLPTRRGRIRDNAQLRGRAGP